MRRRNSFSAPSPGAAAYGSGSHARVATHRLVTDGLRQYLPADGGYVFDPVEECAQYAGGTLGIGFTADEVEFDAVRAALVHTVGESAAARCRTKAVDGAYELQVPESLAAEHAAAHAQQQWMWNAFTQQQGAAPAAAVGGQQGATKAALYSVPWRSILAVTAVLGALVLVILHPELLDRFAPTWTATGEPPEAVAGSRPPPPPPSPPTGPYRGAGGV